MNIRKHKLRRKGTVKLETKKRNIKKSNTKKRKEMNYGGSIFDSIKNTLWAVNNDVDVEVAEPTLGGGKGWKRGRGRTARI